MDNLKRIQAMLTLQGIMNSKVNPDWKTAGYNWGDAIMIEAMEAFDHTNWKWWKDTSKEPDWAQVKLEVVDIWHFVLSMVLESGITADEFLIDIERAMKLAAHSDKEEIQRVLRLLISDSLRGDNLGLVLGLGLLTASVLMDIEDVYNLYVPKNVLNIFRQDNGYKDGTYIKNWATEGSVSNLEDNEVLTIILDTTPHGALTPEYITQRLTEEYALVVKYHAANRATAL